MKKKVSFLGKKKVFWRIKVLAKNFFMQKKSVCEKKMLWLKKFSDRRIFLAVKRFFCEIFFIGKICF